MTRHAVFFSLDEYLKELSYRQALAPLYDMAIEHFQAREAVDNALTVV